MTALLLFHPAHTRWTHAQLVRMLKPGELWVPAVTGKFVITSVVPG
jgi:hypothetical protein